MTFRNVRQCELLLKIFEEKGGEGPLSVLSAAPLFFVPLKRSRVLNCPQVITNQMRSALELVIHPDQTCAVPGRMISESLALLRDMIAHVQDKELDASLISLDQEKAFDRILLNYIQERLPEGAGNIVRRSQGMCKTLGERYPQ
eukprot:g42839.t1